MCRVNIHSLPEKVQLPTDDFPERNYFAKNLIFAALHWLGEKKSCYCVA